MHGSECLATKILLYRSRNSGRSHPEGVSVHTARVPFRDYRTYADPPGPDDCTELLAKLPLRCIVYAFTAGSYLLGPAGEQALVARLEKRSHGIPVLMPCVAVVAAFRALAARRITRRSNG